MGILEIHNEKEKAVFEYLKEVIAESNVINLKKENKYVLSLRIQLIISFSLLEVLANFYSEYINKHDTSTKRFITWVDKYCFSINNTEFIKNGVWSKINGEYLFNLRSSLVHFFGLSEKCNNFYVSIANNDLDNQKISKFKEGFLKRGSGVIFIKPFDFYKLVKEGEILMLNEWREILLANKNNISLENPHVQGIDRIYKKINLDGGFTINYK